MVVENRRPGVNTGSILGMHELIGRIVQRNPVYVIEVDKNEIGLVTFGDLAQTVAETERAGAAGGCRL